MDLFSNNSFIFYFICFALVLVYKWLNTKDYWSNAGIKGPWSAPYFGTMIHFLFEERSNLELKWYNKYGKIYGVMMFGFPVIQIGDPELLKDIMVKDFHLFKNRKDYTGRVHPITDNNCGTLSDGHWKRVRSIIGSAFTIGRAKKLYPIYRHCSNNLLNALNLMDAQEVDMRAMFGKFSLDVSTRNVPINIDIYSEGSDIFIKQIDRIMVEDFTDILWYATFPKSILRYLKVPSIGNYGRRGVVDYFYSQIRNVIHERRKSNQYIDDLIGLLLKAEKNVNDINENEIKSSDHVIDEKRCPGPKRYITENEIIANILVYIWTAYENITSALSFCTHELAFNPEVQEKLYSEIMSCVDSNGEIDYDLVTKLPYLDAVISETLRMHPHQIYLLRMAETDYKLGDTGITLSKGQQIEIPMYAMQNSEDYFENAKQFNPDRFLPENRHKIIPFSFLPFGDGPRQCFAMRLSLIEMKIVLVHLVKQYQFVKPAKISPIQFTSGLLFLTPKRIIIKLVKR